MALRRRAARDIDLFEDRSGGTDRKPRAAILLRDQRGEKAVFGQVLHELGRIGRARLEIAPVSARIFLADAPHWRAQLGVVLAELERDWGATGDWTFDIHQAALRASA